MVPNSPPSYASATSSGKWIAPDSWNNQPVAIAVIVLVVVGVVGGLLINHFRRQHCKQCQSHEELRGLRNGQKKLGIRLRCREPTLSVGPAYPEPGVTARGTSIVDFAVLSDTTTQCQAPMPANSNRGSAARRPGSSRQSPPRIRIPPSPPPLSTPSEVSPLSLSPPEFPQTGNA